MSKLFLRNKNVAGYETRREIPKTSMAIDLSHSFILNQNRYRNACECWFCHSCFSKESLDHEPVQLHKIYFIDIPMLQINVKRHCDQLGRQLDPNIIYMYTSTAMQRSALLIVAQPNEFIPIKDIKLISCVKWVYALHQCKLIYLIVFSTRIAIEMLVNIDVVAHVFQSNRSLEYVARP